MLLKNNETIVFAGDSVTDANKTSTYGLEALGQCLGDGYVHFVHDLLAAEYPELNLRLVNSGIGGNTSQQLCDRWEKDVLEFEPEWISAFIGINDSIGKFLGLKQPVSDKSYELYRKNLEFMVTSALERKAGVILISPYIAEPSVKDPLRADMDEFRRICKETAEKFSCKYLDIQEMFDEYFKIRHQCCIAWDRIHPNRIGSYMIAKEFLKLLEFEF